MVVHIGLTIFRIVEQNITTALVMEDDVDWDLRIKFQMRDFARASRLLVQPLPGTKNQFLDPSYPEPKPGEQHKSFDIEHHETETPITSPYGDIDRWDIFWIGHCGTLFPRAADENTPLARAMIYNDPTVPEPQHINIQGGNKELMNQYPAHTRAVHRAHGNVCTLAYAITQLGARRMLYEMAVHKMDGATDGTFRRACDGKKGRRQRTCLSVQPQLFQHHRPIANKHTFSDISNHGNNMNEVAFTRNIRWSARLNFPQLLDGMTNYHRSVQGWGGSEE